MNEEKIIALAKLGSQVSITAAEIADARRLVAGASQCDQCVAIVEWVIRAAAPLGCAGGEVAINGLFVLADIIFAIADEILVPLEAVVDVAFGVACEAIGAPALEAKAHEYAVDMCKTAKICT